MGTICALVHSPVASKWPFQIALLLRGLHAHNEQAGIKCTYDTTQRSPEAQGNREESQVGPQALAVTTPDLCSITYSQKYLHLVRLSMYYIAAPSKAAEPIY